MRNLLFVPADPRTSQALEKALGLGPKIWDWFIAPNATAARDQLGKKQCDAVVADLGSEPALELLTEVCNSYPEVVRIGVSGQSAAKNQRISFVQQTISSLLDLAQLDIAVERSCRLRDLLQGERICSIVGKVEELPSAPTVFVKLMETLDQPEASIGDVAGIIEGDAAISAKLLQIVNSCIFRTSHDIATVRMAASFLGLEVVKNLVLSLGVFKAFENLPAIAEFSLEDMQAHSRLTAAIAQRLGLSKEAQDAAVVASLLHDIGKLVLAYKMPNRFARLLASAKSNRQPLYRIEEELWGITHAEVGAYLLGLWGLPIRVTEAIAYHHAPSAVPHRGFDAISAVYVANLLAHASNESSEKCEWDLPFLNTVGVAAQVPAWKEIAKEVRLLQREGLQRGFESKERVTVGER
jgi:HD-like signal output (HDOD) protein